jgi:hypothetical protein
MSQLVKTKRQANFNAVTSLPAPVFIRIPVLLRHHASDVIDDRDYLNPGWERNICI